MKMVSKPINILKFLAITHPGNEKIVGNEIKDILSASFSSSCSGTVSFSLKKVEDVFPFCYLAQSISTTLFLFQDFEFSSLDDIKSKLNFANIDPSFFKNSSFGVSCSRLGSHDFASQEVEALVGDVLFEYLSSINLNPVVNLSSPEIPVFAYIFDNHFFLGVDLAGFDLSKRQYRIFHHIDSIKGSLAYSLLRFGDFKKGEVLLDPFSSSGTIAIEAACFSSSYSINFFSKDKFAFRRFPQFKSFDFDSLFSKLDSEFKPLSQIQIQCLDSNQRNLRAAEKNARLANVNKLINFSRFDVEWLDTKFDKCSVDIIASNPPKPSRNADIKSVEKALKEFFYNAEFIIKNSGRVVLMTKFFDFIKPIAESYGFFLVKSMHIFQGQDKIEFVLLKKKVKSV